MWSKTNASPPQVLSEDSSYQTVNCDVLIVGAGGAGLRAAIEVFDRGSNVLIVCKSQQGKAHTAIAEGGIAAALGNVDPEDNWKAHFSDTMVEGQYLSNWKMVQIFAKEAPDRVYELEYFGALFDRIDDGRIMQRPFGAHTHRRLCTSGDETGLELIRTLQDQVSIRDIPFMDEVEITAIFKEESTGRVAGALAVQITTGTLILFRCKSVILATGGCSQVYAVTSTSWESTGDGPALAYRAGAELMDMEMIQFHPTGMVHPPGVRGILVTEAVRAEGGILTNVNGERFMEKYDSKRKELSAQDVLARAIHTEIKAGRETPKRGVYLDIRHRGADYIKKKLPHLYEQFLEFAGVDITKEKMEVAPTAHYQIGGIRVDPDSSETSIRGLYAVGEVAGGLHGANRLGGNSLSDILVFGKRAGASASDYTKIVSLPSISEQDVQKEISRILRPFKVKNGVNPFQLKEKVSDVMWQYAGIVRNEQDLSKGLEEIGRIRLDAKNVEAKGPRVYNQSWEACLSVWNMLLVCEVIIRSGITRKESRGAHTRSDYPDKDDSKWLVNIITKLQDGRMNQELKPVPRLPPEIEVLVKNK